MISPDELSNILGEGSNNDDDSVSSPDELECLLRAILHQENVPDEHAGTAPNLQNIPEDLMWDPNSRSQAHPDLLPIFADDAEAAAIHEFHRLNNLLETSIGPYHHSLARKNMRTLEEEFPYIDFPGFLQKATKIFPEYFDHVLSAAAPSTGLKPIG